jgi:hypothetical protein
MRKNPTESLTFAVPGALLLLHLILILVLLLPTLPLDSRLRLNNIGSEAAAIRCEKKEGMASAVGQLEIQVGQGRL